MADGTLNVSPPELKFKFELRKQIPTELRLSNPHAGPVAFKVKTTSPRKYCVRPNTGVVEPYGTVTVTVIMQQQKEWPADSAMCKDKFLLQTVAVGGASQQPDDLSALFSKASGERVTEIKLKVRASSSRAHLPTRSRFHPSQHDAAPLTRTTDPKP
jgi:hypothetical protein